MLPGIATSPAYASKSEGGSMTSFQQHSKAEGLDLDDEAFAAVAKKDPRTHSRADVEAMARYIRDHRPQQSTLVKKKIPKVKKKIPKTGFSGLQLDLFAKL
jgi:hypothetical protein